MSSETFLPPLRELPPDRLFQRAQHLRAEIARQRRSAPALVGRSRILALAALALALAAVLLATPAFGLRDHIRHLFADDEHPPELIQRYFRNQSSGSGPPGTPSGALAGRARIALAASVPGYGSRVLWVAPTKAGGFCSTWIGCNARRTSRFQSTLIIAGPTSRNSSPMPDSPDVHVFFQGQTILRRAASAVIRFEDGSLDRVRIVWVPKPIDAGFFLYELPKAHWKVGERPVALSLQDAKGERLARNTADARFFREAQTRHLAPPSAAESNTSPLWSILAAATAIVVAAGLVAWMLRIRRGGRP
jgi:hypothetical protein